MTIMDEFWAEIKAQLTALESATSADEVIEILGGPAEGADAFFAGSGGDEGVWEALATAGWSSVWSEADYYWIKRAPNGDLITYIEGDIYRGDRSNRQEDDHA